MYNPNHLRCAFIIISTILLVSGCTSDPAEGTLLTDTGHDGDIQTADVDSGPNVDTDANLDSSPDTNSEDSGGEFRKPDTSEANVMETTSPFSPHTDSTPNSQRHGPGARPHMMATRFALESWLYPGEYFVIDRAVVQHNMWWFPSDFYFIVLHEGQPLPFHLHKVEVPHSTIDGEYPPIEEIESWDEELFDEVAIVHRDHGTPLYYTLVIPPWAFPEEGAYNIQILDYPIWEPIEGAFRLAMKPASIGPSTHATGFTAHTIYYGSTELVTDVDDVDNRQDDAVEWETTDPGPFMAQTNFMLLATPLDVCDWLAPESHSDPNCLAEELTYSEKKITLEFYVAGGNGLELRDSDTRGTNLYYVMRNAEVIDMFFLDPGEVEYNDVVAYETDKGLVMPIEVELTESRAAYQIVAVPEPFEPKVKDWDLYMLQGNLPVESNALLLRYDPEE